MAGETFVDTSGFYAILVARDGTHGKAKRLLGAGAKKKARFVTTDYVLDETATLPKARGHGHLLPALFDTIASSQACRTEWMNAERFARTKSFFLKRQDHAWSFTDCFSFTIMRELRIEQALTKDRHFLEAGFTPLLT